LKIENRVVVSSNTSSFPRRHFVVTLFFPLNSLQFNLTLFLFFFLEKIQNRFVLRVWEESAKRFTD
tara:strand:- start:117 stop:314 length:198 start_codon:yes stop_codon:yes gene_type:complete